MHIEQWNKKMLGVIFFHTLRTVMYSGSAVQKGRIGVLNFMLWQKKKNTFIWNHT